MIYSDDEEPELGFDHHMQNIPIIPGERDADTYLRAFDHMLSPAPPSTSDADWIYAAAKSAVRFIADDAFRRGFESCHDNVVTPLRHGTISTDQALQEMRRHGDLVRQAIIAKFEEAPGVPNQLTVDIDEIELPAPRVLQ